MSFTFIDLFAGIGGFRKGLESIGGRCVLTCERDKFARQTYKANFDCSNHTIYEDITKLHTKDIPFHDILCAGFPCQSFSIAGIGTYRHRNLPTGFDAKGKGNLFFDVVRILDAKRPKAFILENVKNLLSHNNGQTFATIRIFLEQYLGYKVQYRVINAKNFVPQNRERVFIVGFKKQNDFNINDLVLPQADKMLMDILEKDIDIDDSYTISDYTWQKYQKHKIKHQQKGNGFGYRIGDKMQVSHTITASYYNDKTKALLLQENKNPRYLTTTECKRIMGFGDDFIMNCSKTQIYKQLGNAVVPHIVKFLGSTMLPYILNEDIQCYFSKFLCKRQSFDDILIEKQKPYL